MTSLKELTDEELVLLIAEDNNKAFKVLYDRYWKKMLVKAFFQLKCHVLAEEVVQEAFINLWKRRHTVQLKYTFHTYIASVVRYEVMSAIARRGKQPLFIEDIKLAPIADNSTAHWLAFEELRERVESHVSSLPEKCQLVFRMSREQGLSDRQISECLEISHKTVEAHMCKALKTLRLNLSHLSTIALLPAFISFLFF